MKKSYRLFSSVLSLSLCASVYAADKIKSGEDLAKAANCMACHKIEARVVGPSYNDVIRKYRQQIENSPDQATEEANVRDYLFKKIKDGGGGVWGKVPMPANVHVSDEDTHKLVDWLMSIDPEIAPTSPIQAPPKKPRKAQEAEEAESKPDATPAAE